VPTAAETTAGTPGPQGSLDSKHHFVLELQNVPMGSRGEMKVADGPMNVAVRTRYLMPEFG
jgi:hypothetical protein